MEPERAPRLGTEDPVTSSDSIPPIPGGNNNLKYGLMGVGLIIAAAAAWFGMQSCEGESQPQPPVVEADAGTEPTEPSRALVDDELLIPEVEPDAGPPPDAGQAVRYVTRYVGGGGNWTCSGSIPPQAAAARLAESQRQFRNCYERRLKVNHQLEGRVNMSLRVDRSGAVDAVQLGGTMRDSEVLSCVRRIARNLRFPAPTGGSCAVVAAPLNFTARN